MFSIFVALTNAFDTFSKGGLLMIMTEYHCLMKPIALEQQFLEGMQARVQTS
ncbi:hypothetical protein DPMN_041763 [Dreissena polymorpha]|uniref:Uncharacterized protein n=1 Tax=Dreissena polymorpha TaxID=45954 RepID=A0A9D4CXJ7_DREPO|nr:hypothetical protein DPMN_041763 [Dreissena polymorpha]